MKNAAKLAILACTVLCATPAAAEVRFRGALTLTYVRDCIARYVGETFNSTFRPASIGGNPNVSSLTSLNQFSGDVYELAGANFVLNKWTPVNVWGLDNLHYEFDAQIAITSQTPAPINAASGFLFMTGYILNMGNDPGVGGKKCVAGFRGAWFRRVE